MNTAIEIEKKQIMEVPAEYQEEIGCAFLQIVKITYSFYGAKMTEYFDTKILPNGKQVVINGN